MVKIKPVRVPAAKNKKKAQALKKKKGLKAKSNSKGMLTRKFKSGPGRSPAGSKAIKSDARLKIISKNRSKVVDARDKLVSLAKTSDARQKLTKIRNLKEGKLDVKTTKGGAITITKTTKGQVLLTTKKNETTSKKSTNATPQARSLNTSNKNVTRNVGRGGVVSLSTRPKQDSTLRNNGSARGNPTQARPTYSAGGRPVLVPARERGIRDNRQTSNRNLTRTIQGEVSDAAKLDMELLNTRVNPRTYRQDIERERERRQRTHFRNERERSPIELPSLARSFRSGGARRLSPDLYDDRRLPRARSRSPMDTTLYDDRNIIRRSTGAKPFSHYDDPRHELEREEAYRRLARRNQDEQRTSFTTGDRAIARTLGDRIESGATGVSPLQGAKVVVSNLQDSVSQEDILELFGDIGALKRAKVSEPGSAEVTFVNRSDALKAVEIYHNRQLDGKAMRCTLVGDGGFSIVNNKVSSGVNSKSSSLDSSHLDHRAPPPELNTIHRALFSDKKKSDDTEVATKPLFTVTMPKKGNLNNRQTYN